MRLHGLVPSVDCADLLDRGIARWRQGLDRLIVVTTPQDERTIAVARAAGAELYTTTVFHEHSAAFNKGAGLSAAAIAMDWAKDADWLVSFDADIVPPEDWRQQVEAAQPIPGRLYGSRRWQIPEHGPLEIPEDADPMPQGWVIGFFMLFHASDPHLQSPPFDICWPHAGNYDTEFSRRWPTSLKSHLPLRLMHLGAERRNWCGRGRQAELRRILGARRGDRWEHERMPVLPTMPEPGSGLR